MAGMFKISNNKMTNTSRVLSSIYLLISLLGVVAIVADFGIPHSDIYEKVLNIFYFFVIGIGLFSTIFRYIARYDLVKRKVFIFDLFSVGFTIWLFTVYLFVGEILHQDLRLHYAPLVKIVVLLTFFREFSELRINLKRTVFNPAQMFIISFMAMIFLGSFLLILPNATNDSISYLDALFTATSAVCVTGLVVVDTGSHFSFFGQVIIMCLIQLGGLGILTFTSYFSYFFKGGTSYENHLALKDMMSYEKLGEVFSTLKYIILITFGIEIFSAMLIYMSLDAANFRSLAEKLFFSAFHSISSFCNAGFSLLHGGFYDPGFRFNYYLQLVIVFSFILGGLGFPIVVNILKYIRYRTTNFFLFSKKKARYRPWVLNLNSRITLITTFSITFIATIAFYVFELNDTLAIHYGVGKVITALFGAATPRTAGFNTIDTAAMTFPTQMMVILLMWIGASPQSTGGGIKTSTFAIATLNILSIARGKHRIEIFRREISDLSVRRAFAIMCLSLLVIGFAITAISISEPDKSLVSISFECFSAYSTVGLSLGITSDLSDISKTIIIVVMFVGRISMLTVVIAVFKRIKHKNYKYPQEEITIN